MQKKDADHRTMIGLRLILIVVFIGCFWWTQAGSKEHGAPMQMEIIGAEPLPEGYKEASEQPKSGYASPHRPPAP